MTSARILFIEDDDSGREMGAFNLRKAGYEVDTAENGARGLALFESRRHDLVITDLRMPEVDGMAVLQAVKASAPETPVLVITAYGSVDTAVRAMKQGAADFVGKPFNREHLLLAVERALEERRLRDEVRSLRRKASGVERDIVYRSEAMGRVLEIADRVAPTEATVLITGETGTGKELVARRIHSRGKRADGPFVVVNCAAIPAELIESELFGHEKGAFTGASKGRSGRFRQAIGGTIFLDEVGELPQALQAKLLRVLQERVVDVVGADEPVPIDVRVVAATHRDLVELTREGSFREDLFYRLSVVEIAIPPLRDRPDDVEPLVTHFVAHFAPGQELRVGPELLAELERRRWPGNVRQLQNAVERLTILCEGTELRVEDLPPVGAAEDAGGSEPKDAPSEWPPLPEEGLGLVDLEKRVIERVLELKGGNVSQAAAYLRVPRHILAYRMAKYGVARR